MRFLTLLTLLTVALTALADGDLDHAAVLPKVAIVIDDMGYRQSDSHAFSLPTHVTFAILPHTLQSKKFSEQAYQEGRTVILHLPMETQRPRNLGEGALVDSMDRQMMVDTFNQALATVPHAQGVNNHMGSKLTQLTLPMTILMQTLQDQDLFFMDSRTTRYSKAFRIANQTGVPAVQRRVFLDHEITEAFIDEQFDRLIRLAHKYGHAIGIGHPHPLTVERLNARLQQHYNVEFVSLAKLVATLHPNAGLGLRFAHSEQKTDTERSAPQRENVAIDDASKVVTTLSPSN
ncbi:divergent polysaccharide deacetylase family protein [Alteromonas sp. ASW11-36]|uniref:Divergent polysaccharide deacetylase family protein n=1 Tax=Alteromonas arenosi TaxID=3055817 RepID=A0ABT7SZH4_9ALTE|nr:divergent polysaccharide deacetylase family protein [Alteromonas sp. ASW11-36]MDM7861582.1 divergent polysaccharide deacetylase family protein [Alteromonas sp. ASW11-36]